MEINKNIVNRTLPHIIAILVFIVISAIYFSPQLNRYRLSQSDVIQNLGMKKEIKDFRDKFDSEPLWTSSTFSGMPAYQISVRYDKDNWIKHLEYLFFKYIVNRPIAYVLLLMAGFYILLLCFNVNPWAAIIGGLAFGLASFNILYLATGHNAKVLAISYIPPLIGSIIYAYRKNFLAGSALLSIFTCLHLSANHIQMSYYLIYFLIAIILVEFFIHLKSNLLPKFFKISAVLLLAGVLGILPTISSLIVTNEYGKHTTRGKSELTISAENMEKSSMDALDSEYIKRYSLGAGEVWSLVIPNVKGGANGYIGQNKDIMKKIPRDYRKTISQQSSYWGEQYGSGGAFYYGATVFVLFVLGIFFIKDKIKWAILSISVLAIILSLKYSSVVDFFIEHVPLYNKFRDTKMMLVLVQVSFPLLGILFVNKLISNGIDRKKFLYVSIGLGSIFFLFYVTPRFWFDFLSRNETQQINAQLANYRNDPGTMRQIEDWKNELINARILIFKKDSLRTLFFVLATALLIYLFLIRKFKERTFLILLGILVLIDLWGVDKRYLNNKKRGARYLQWVDSYKYENPFEATVADMKILEHEMEASPSLKQKIDNEVNKLQKNRKLKTAEFKTEKEKVMFRELNFSTNYRTLSLLNPFNESRTSYYHKSIGGYHGAKLKKYQELIEFQISPEINDIVNVINSESSNESMEGLLKSEIPVLNMLNTKYIIYNLSAPPIVNMYHYGNAWFVNNIKFVKNADEEILSLSSIDKNTAVLNEKYRNKLAMEIEYDSSAFIQLKSYKPNHLVYETSAGSDQLAVFSEIFYEDGWNAYIDGERTDYIKANYILRSIIIPEGKHIVEFKFEPQSYYLGRRISHAGSGLIIIFVLGVILFELRKRKKLEESNT
jgi:hypothetical protein